ncbi:MAG: hypothetical protein UX85_C0001G0249 [Candidatus Beckwithbacteria bacterium GW2011_GWB1_47_15]|uniref:Uncharacterized protein n=1 Tax=Candidatus Beckwithbacteria bacterium GW2011_GWB1_47_15 TaxID=1618371 RepID=A0A0G1UWE9_9BACT|nr:MAG: hypothetical protein UY43_C0001G0876 [Candidatus Beckwithbacteria bacterium GW2011_GWC1_49_16]AQS30887.1 hypothetical protein [uncultured bacterium]KKU36071.1 MAG: hypothetical protein UX50_C0001G0248 [Candidatus Beckwithbacteria bacterium GW2011_GWA1_46_30]KKU62035.1 MAG: hypothetical protein UX85_C0001G0249 [Candidatus Beckwithbacteria bacterium GW2011_GWB1_47_15]KKU72412.1 MAG: hypothetical protein UX97_C0001G0282 [Candidatus Beckwithbacteria bacterium GW2011_GWA2_47_25]OGD49319.1 M
MKKALIFLVVGLVVAVLAWAYLPRTDETKTRGEPDYASQGLSEDTGLTTLEQETNETETLDFEADLNTLDQEINQL